MKNIYRFIVAAVIIISASSCEDFIDVGQPPTQITSKEIFSEIGTADAAVNENYVLFRENVLLTGKANGLSILLGLYTDELDNWVTSNKGFQSFYTNTLVPSEPILQTVWNGSYSLIYNCNRIIEGLGAESPLSQVDKDRLMGEALFLRTLTHFYLMQLFENVPHVTNTDYRLNSTALKIGENEMYRLLEIDALRALKLLPDTGEGNSNVRVGANAVRFFLARLYLYQQNWSQAFYFSDQLIEGGAYPLEKELYNVFLKDSSGTIWQLKSAVEGGNAHEGQSFIFFNLPPPNRSITNSLVDSFEEGDLRKINWTGFLGTAPQQSYYAFKYKESKPTSASREYSIVFRIEEMYYIRLEAALRIGDTESALTDWNNLRTRYELKTFNGIPANWEYMLAEERRHEFFCEMGHRFFDLKRMGMLKKELSKTKPFWKEWFVRLPLPESELLLNTNLLPQNEGY